MTGVSVDEAMRRAIELAARGLGTTSPNPVVGCVLLDAGGQVVGEGFHAYAGGPHAEIVALAQAGERARGGTAVVTLEPCDHTGRTGPCSLALIQAGVARVVIAVPDPNPVASGGAATLRSAGVRVDLGVRASEAEAGNIAWLTSMRRGWPYVIWKYAATLDGRSAAADGTSMWITSEAARIDVHALRGTVDAVVVGVGTVLADDPRLTARNLRDGSLAIRQPLRVVVDSEGVPPPTPGSATARPAPGSPPPRRSAPARTAGWTCRRCSPSCTSAACGRCCWRAVPAWPARSWPPGWSTRSSDTSHPGCSAPDRPRSSTRV